MLITTKIAYIIIQVLNPRFLSIHMISYMHSHLFITEFTSFQHNDQLPVGLLAQLVEHCIGIAKAMGSNPVQACINFRPLLHPF